MREKANTRKSKKTKIFSSLATDAPAQFGASCHKQLQQYSLLFCMEHAVENIDIFYSKVIEFQLICFHSNCCFGEMSTATNYTALYQVPALCPYLAISRFVNNF